MDDEYEICYITFMDPANQYHFNDLWWRPMTMETHYSKFKTIRATHMLMDGQVVLLDFFLNISDARRFLWFIDPGWNDGILPLTLAQFLDIQAEYDRVHRGGHSNHIQQFSNPIKNKKMWIKTKKKWKERARYTLIEPTLRHYDMIYPLFFTITGYGA